MHICLSLFNIQSTLLFRDEALEPRESNDSAPGSGVQGAKALAGVELVTIFVLVLKFWVQDTDPLSTWKYFIWVNIALWKIHGNLNLRIYTRFYESICRPGFKVVSDSFGFIFRQEVISCYYQFGNF